MSLKSPFELTLLMLLPLMRSSTCPVVRPAQRMHRQGRTPSTTCRQWPGADLSQQRPIQCCCGHVAMWAGCGGPLATQLTHELALRVAQRRPHLFSDEPPHGFRNTCAAVAEIVMG